MAPPQESTASFRQSAAVYATEPKRMRLSASARSTAAAGSSTTTRASTGAPTAMTNKGSVYKAQRGRAVTAAAVKAKAPTTHRRRGRKGKSVYRGVCVTREGKWRAVIYKERKQLYLGVYESEVDAAKAHDRAARFHFAENAVCNFDSEHEADRQAVIHKQRQLLEQQQLAENRAHAQLHGGSFSVGREEFDDLDEYHRGMDEACDSEEDDREADAEAEREEEGDGEGSGEDCGDGYEEVCSRSSRSMSSSCSSSMSSGSMSDDCGSAHHTAESSASDVSAFEPAFYSRGPGTTVASTGAGRGGGVGNGNQLHSRERGCCSSGDSDSDYAAAAGVATASPLIPDAEQPSAQEGMGFPYAEDLLGYEMQSWYCCQDDDDRSPASSGGAAYESQLQQQQPFMGRQQQSEELWGSAVGANLGWGFGDFAQAYSDGGSRASSGSMSSGSLSCDDDYVPSALPPLMGISGEP